MVVVDRGKAHCQMVGMARKKDKLELLGSEIENEKWKKNDNKRPLIFLFALIISFFPTVSFFPSTSLDPSSPCI